MSNSGPPSVLPEEDYDTIEAAVMETSRGRWFLNEYAKRNRNADTELLLEAIGRLHKMLLGDNSASSVPGSFRAELMEMAQAIARTRREIASMHAEQGDDSKLVTATEELDAIVEATEKATSSILSTAEQIQEIAWTMRESGVETRTCDALDRFATDIYTACSFQDLTGQRTQKVVKVLRFIESRVNAMIHIWGLEDDLTARDASKARPELHLLNGPAVEDGGSPQEEVDEMMAEPAPRVDPPAWTEVSGKQELVPVFEQRAAETPPLSIGSAPPFTGAEKQAAGAGQAEGAADVFASGSAPASEAESGSATAKTIDPRLAADLDAIGASHDVPEAEVPDQPEITEPSPALSQHANNAGGGGAHAQAPADAGTIPTPPPENAAAAAAPQDDAMDPAAPAPERASGALRPEVFAGSGETAPPTGGQTAATPSGPKLSTEPSGQPGADIFAAPGDTEPDGHQAQSSQEPGGDKAADRVAHAQSIAGDAIGWAGDPEEPDTLQHFDAAGDAVTWAGSARDDETPRSSAAPGHAPVQTPYDLDSLPARETGGADEPSAHYPAFAPSLSHPADVMAEQAASIQSAGAEAFAHPGVPEGEGDPASVATAETYASHASEEEVADIFAPEEDEQEALSKLAAAIEERVEELERARFAEEQSASPPREEQDVPQAPSAEGAFDEGHAGPPGSWAGTQEPQADQDMQDWQSDFEAEESAPAAADAIAAPGSRPRAEPQAQAPGSSVPADEDQAVGGPDESLSSMLTRLREVHKMAMFS